MNSVILFTRDIWWLVCTMKLRIVDIFGFGRNPPSYVGFTFQNKTDIVKQ